MNNQTIRKSSLPIREEGLMDELLHRHEKARQDLQLAEARLALQRAQAELVDAEIRVKLLQAGAGLESPRNSRDEAAPDHRLSPAERLLRADPEASRLQQELDRAVNRYDKLSQVIHPASDPRLVRAGRDVSDLRSQLHQVSSRLLLRTLEPPLPPRAQAPRSQESPNPRSLQDIDRKLDLLLDELLTPKPHINPYHTSAKDQPEPFAPSASAAAG